MKKDWVLELFMGLLLGVAVLAFIHYATGR